MVGSTEELVPSLGQGLEIEQNEKIIRLEGRVEPLDIELQRIGALEIFSIEDLVPQPQRLPDFIGGLCHPDHEVLDLESDLQTGSEMGQISLTGHAVRSSPQPTPNL